MTYNVSSWTLTLLHLLYHLLYWFWSWSLTFSFSLACKSSLLQQRIHMLSLLIKCCRHVSANERFRGPLIRSLVFTRPVDVNARLAGYRRCRQDEPPTRLYRTTGQRPSTTDPRSSQAELPGLVSGPAGGCEPGLWSDEAGSGFNARLPQTTVEHRPDQTGSLVPRQSLGTSWSTTVQVVSLLLPRPATACNVVYCFRHLFRDDL